MKTKGMEAPLTDAKTWKHNVDGGEKAPQRPLKKENRETFFKV